MAALRLDCYPLFKDPPLIVPGASERDWMDQTPDRFAYRCTPLSIANASGWEIINPVGLTVTWNGSPGLDAIAVRADDGSVPAYASSHFGSGILTFQAGYLFRTDPDWVIWCRGAPNRMKAGIVPLDGIVETNWAPFTFTMNWRFLEPGSVRFEAGEPFCFFSLWPSVALESVTPRLRALASDPELEREYTSWRDSRLAFNRKLAEHDPEAQAQKWQRFYLKGQSTTGHLRAADDHRIKRRLHAPQSETPLDDLCPVAASYVQRVEGGSATSQGSGSGVDETSVFVVNPAVTAGDGAPSMNETVRLAVARMDGSRSMGDIIDCLLEEFDVERERLAADILRLAEDLLARGAIARVL